MSPVKPYIPVLMMRSDEPAASPEVAGDGYVLALALQPDVGEGNPELVRLLIGGNRPFLLLLDCNLDYTASATMDLIRLCMFSRAYVQSGAAPTLAFTGAGAGGCRNEFTRLLLEKLQLQGWPSIAQWHLSALPFDAQLAGRQAPLLLDAIGFDEAYLKSHYFADPGNLGSHIFFKAGSLQAALQLEQDFFALCSREMQGNAVLMAYLAEKKALDALRLQHGVLQERFKSATTTIGVIRHKYKDDYNELFTWHRNEYEILPLWYKRFGHILKVIMGRRTLRSLFNDSVKKYKD